MSAEPFAHPPANPKLTPAQAANSARLRGCAKPHVFVRRLNDAGVPTRQNRYVCRLCGGIVRGDARAWYLSGLADARLGAGRHA